MDDFDPDDIVEEPKKNGTHDLHIPGPARKQRHAKQAARVAPHSIEAEESILACCLLDDGESVDVAMRALEPEAFFSPANRTMFETLTRMRRSGLPIDNVILGQELLKEDVLEAIGGFAQLMHVTSRVPTTAHRSYFIEQLRHFHVLRTAQKSAMQILDDIQHGSDVAGTAEALRTRVNELSANAIGGSLTVARSLASYRWPTDDGTALLGTERRYLCRGGAAMIIGNSGMGKSVAAYQMAATYSAGRPFMGINCCGPLRCLTIQGEDDAGDIGEVAESVRYGLNFTKAEDALFERNCYVITDKVNSGERFILALRSYVKAFNPDLVFINPLLSYCGGDIAKQEVATRFLREGLNAVNQELGGNFAYIVVHHTPKPKEEEKKKGKATGDHVRQYLAYGSSELTNWPRAIIVLEQRVGTSEPGQYYMHLAKRGVRAGVVKKVEQGAGFRWDTITKIPAQHSRQKLAIDGKEHSMVLWEPSALDAQEAKEAANKPAPKPMVTGRKPVWSPDQLVEYFPLGELSAKPITEVQRTAQEVFGFPKSAFFRARDDLLNEKRIFKTEAGLWHR